MRAYFPITTAILWITSPAHAQFTSFQGSASEELAWRAAAGGSVPLETFEGFTGTPNTAGTGDPVSSLPNLGVTLRTATPGVFPGVYDDITFAHSGRNQLANFGAGAPAFSDFWIEPEPGRAIVALGFWQADPQGHQPMVAYDENGAPVGTIVGLINNGAGNSFAGFVSTTPIFSVLVDGSLGDGWNHIDDMQITTISVCLPDLNGDGILDNGDINAFIAAFLAGC